MLKMPRASSPGYGEPSKEAEARLILRIGTQAQRRSVLEESAQAWQGELSTTQFVILNLLADRASKAHFLVLVDRDQPDGDVYVRGNLRTVSRTQASAELWPRTAYVVRPGSTEIEELKAVCLHHLWVPPAKRMQAYGKLCLRRLHEWTCSNDENGVRRFDLIYGIAVRVRPPWKTRHLLVTEPRRIRPYTGSLVVEPVFVNELDGIVKHDNELIMQELLAKAPIYRPLLAIANDTASLLCFINLAQYKTQLDKTEPVDIVGWRIDDANWFIAVPKLSENALLVLRVRATTKEHMAALMAATARWCIHRGNEKIRCHGDVPIHRDMLELTGVQHEVSDDTALSVQWLDPELVNSTDYDWHGTQLYLNCTPVSGTKLELATLP